MGHVSDVAFCSMADLTIGLLMSWRLTALFGTFATFLGALGGACCACCVMAGALGTGAALFTMGCALTSLSCVSCGFPSSIALSSFEGPTFMLFITFEAIGTASLMMGDILTVFTCFFSDSVALSSFGGPVFAPVKNLAILATRFCRILEAAGLALVVLSKVLGELIDSLARLALNKNELESRRMKRCIILGFFGVFEFR